MLNTPAPPLSENHRTMAMAAHLSALISIIGIPGIVGPLIVYLVWKDEHPFVRRQAAEALNFQILATVVTLALAVMSFILMWVLIGFLLMPLVIVVPIVAFVFSIIGAIEAQKGNDYRYPLNWRLVT